MFNPHTTVDKLDFYLDTWVNCHSLILEVNQYLDGVYADLRYMAEKLSSESLDYNLMWVILDALMYTDPPIRTRSDLVSLKKAFELLKEGKLTLDKILYVKQILMYRKFRFAPKIEININ